VVGAPNPILPDRNRASVDDESEFPDRFIENLCLAGFVDAE
jgi:hypothetical protein